MEKTLQEQIQELINLHGKDKVSVALNDSCPEGYIRAPDGTCIKDILQNS